MKLDQHYRRPTVHLPDDVGDVMARMGTLVAISRSRALWRFGFLRNSTMHQLSGASHRDFLWVLANRSGQTLAEWEGAALELPPRFKAVIEAKLWR